MGAGVMRPRVLVVLTSCERVAGAPAGVWLPDFAAAWVAFAAAGAELTLASPLGGPPPIDPASDDRARRTEAVRAFMADREAREALADTLRLDQVAPDDFDAAFYPDGSGVAGDLAGDPRSIALIAALAAAGRPLGFVSRGTAALARAGAVPAGLLVTGDAAAAVARALLDLAVRRRGPPSGSP